MMMMQSLKYDTNVSEDLAASIFRVKWLAMGKNGKDIGRECKMAADAAGPPKRW